MPSYQLKLSHIICQSSACPSIVISLSVLFLLPSLFLCSDLLPPIPTNPVTENWSLVIYYGLAEKLPAAFQIPALTECRCYPLHPHPECFSSPLQPTSPPAVWTHDSSADDTRTSWLVHGCEASMIMVAFLQAVWVRTVCNKACVIWIIERCWC